MSGIRPLPSTQDLEEIFSALDADRSRGISYDELNGALTGGRPIERKKKKQGRRGLPPTEKRDVGLNGARQHRKPTPMDFEALRKRLKAKNVTAGQLFSMMDADRSNNITVEEFQRGLAMSGIRPLPSTPALEEMWSRLDIDRSRGISYDELSLALSGGLERHKKPKRGRRAPRHIDTSKPALDRPLPSPGWAVKAPVKQDGGDELASPGWAVKPSHYAS